MRLLDMFPFNKWSAEAQLSLMIYLSFVRENLGKVVDFYCTCYFASRQTLNEARQTLRQTRGRTTMKTRILAILISISCAPALACNVYEELCDDFEAPGYYGGSGDLDSITSEYQTVEEIYSQWCNTGSPRVLSGVRQWRK